MDSWVKREHISPDAIPKKIGICLNKLTAQDPNDFPFNFLQYVKKNMTYLLNSFLALFGGFYKDYQHAAVPYLTTEYPLYPEFENSKKSKGVYLISYKKSAQKIMNLLCDFFIADSDNIEKAAEPRHIKDIHDLLIDIGDRQAAVGGIDCLLRTQQHTQTGRGDVAELLKIQQQISAAGFQFSLQLRSGGGVESALKEQLDLASLGFFADCHSESTSFWLWLALL